MNFIQRNYLLRKQARAIVAADRRRRWFAYKRLNTHSVAEALQAIFVHETGRARRKRNEATARARQHGIEYELLNFERALWAALAQLVELDAHINRNHSLYLMDRYDFVFDTEEEAPIA